MVVASTLAFLAVNGKVLLPLSMRELGILSGFGCIAGRPFGFHSDQGKAGSDGSGEREAFRYVWYDSRHAIF